MMVNWTYPKDFFKQRKRWMQGIYMVCRLFFFRICSQIFLFDLLLVKILIKVKMFARFRSRLIPMKSKFILSISLGELQLLQLYSHLHQHHEKRPELKCHLRHFKPNSAQPVITSKMFFSSAAWLTMPLTTLNVVLSKAYPMSVSPSIDFLVRWIPVTRIVTPSVHV